jgi:hypothetical protein
MAHHVEHGAYMGRPAWHKIGVTVEKRMSVTEFVCGPAKMGYRVSKVPAYHMDADGQFVQTPGQFHLQRDNDYRIVSPSTVTDAYAPVCPLDLVRILEPWYEQGFGTPDAAFILYEGMAEVVTMLLDDHSKPISDQSEWSTYLFTQNYHNRGKVRAKLIRHRAVCHNTTPKHGFDIAFVHRQSVQDNIDQVRHDWKAAREAIASHNAALDLLASKRVNIPSTVDALLEIKKGEKITTQKENKRSRMIAAANNPAAGTSGESLVDIYNGVTWINTHFKGGKSGKTDQGRMTSILDGTRGKMDADMFDKLLMLV